MPRSTTTLVLGLWLLLTLIATGATAAQPPASTPKFDAVHATDAYLASLTPAERARSDAYFEGGEWLQLWSFLYGAAVYLVLLMTGLSARLRDVATRITRRKTLQSVFYWLQFLLVTTILMFPLSIYSGYFREHQYGLSNQTFGAWGGDELKSLLVGAIFGSLLIAALYAVIRRSPRRWWLWGAVTVIAFITFGAAIGPVYIAPLFNKYTKLEDPRVRGPILQMARSNGIDAKDVWVVDASRQSKRISANVSGLFGTQRITLNDNLLRRATLPEIEAVMAHEMGHYVLNHVYKMLVFFGIVVLVAFAILKYGMEAILRRKGDRWRIEGVADPAGLPLLALLLSAVMFVFTPVTNGIIRVQEIEADAFGLNLARQPDGFATISLKLGEYRKLAPGPVEETLFFDHPSGRNRILMAMRWKAEHLEDSEQAPRGSTTPSDQQPPEPRQ
ncbi:MAG: M48 family metallopeptidase [Thermoanaerobaculia bacterium]